MIKYLEEIPIHVLFELLIEAGNVDPMNLAVTREMRDRVARATALFGVFERLSCHCFPLVTQLPIDSAHYLMTGRYGAPRSGEAQNAAWRAHFNRLIGLFGELQFEVLTEIVSNRPHDINVFVGGTFQLRENTDTFLNWGENTFRVNVWDKEARLVRIVSDFPQPPTVSCDELTETTVYRSVEFRGISRDEMFLGAPGFVSQGFNLPRSPHVISPLSVNTSTQGRGLDALFGFTVDLHLVNNIFVDFLIRESSIMADVPRTPLPHRTIELTIRFVFSPQLVLRVFESATFEEIFQLVTTIISKRNLNLRPQLEGVFRLNENVKIYVIYSEHRHYGVKNIRLDQVLGATVTEALMNYTEVRF